MGGFEGALSDKQETLTFSSALSSMLSHCEWQSPGTEGRGGGDKRWEFSENETTEVQNYD